jgi:hypothetical protein
MAMERPIADGIRGEIPCDLAAWLNDDSVLARRMIAVASYQLKKMTVNVDRVPHHAVVDEVDPNAFAFEKGIGSILSDILTPSKDHMKRSMLPVR